MQFRAQVCTSTDMITAKSAFVLQIDEADDAVHGRMVGRVEHVLSGAAHEFRCSADLLAFIQQALAPQTAENS